MRDNDLRSRHRPQNHDLTAVNRQARRRYRQRLRAATQRASPPRRFGRWLDRRLIALGAAVRRLWLMPLGGDALEFDGYGEGLASGCRAGARVEPMPRTGPAVISFSDQGPIVIWDDETPGGQGQFVGQRIGQG